VAQKLKQALLDLSASAEGRQMLMEVAEIDGLREVDDSVYDSVRKMVQDVGLDLQEYLRRDEEKQKQKAAGKKG
jgi:ABC-type phosphate/phosphonate transport system substrate-binding protein